MQLRRVGIKWIWMEMFLLISSYAQASSDMVGWRAHLGDGARGRFEGGRSAMNLEWRCTIRLRKGGADKRTSEMLDGRISWRLGGGRGCNMPGITGVNLEFKRCIESGFTTNSNVIVKVIGF
jgi:hypothetical protein